MAAPAALTDFGSPVPGRVIAKPRTHHPRFAAIRARLHGTYPTVRPGQVWADMDPRSAGRAVLVREVLTNGTTVVETLKPRTCDPRTPSRTRKDTAGSTHVIATHRFKPGSRGFRLVAAMVYFDVNGKPVNADVVEHSTGSVRDRSQREDAAGAPLAGQVDAGQVDALVALLSGRRKTRAQDYRVAAALRCLLGYEQAHAFLTTAFHDDMTGAELYRDSGVTDVMYFATQWGIRVNLLTI